MDPTIKTKNLTSDKQSWLGSEHGTESADSVKITITSTEVTNWGTTLPSGIPLNRDGTVDPNGTAKAVHGFLLEPIDITRGAGTYSGALLWHGQVIDAQRTAKGLTALTADQKTSIAAATDLIVV